MADEMDTDAVLTQDDSWKSKGYVGNLCKKYYRVYYIGNLKCIFIYIFDWKYKLILTMANKQILISG